MQQLQLREMLGSMQMLYMLLVLGIILCLMSRSCLQPVSLRACGIKPGAPSRPYCNMLLPEERVPTRHCALQPTFCIGRQEEGTLCYWSGTMEQGKLLFCCRSSCCILDNIQRFLRLNLPAAEPCSCYECNADWHGTPTLCELPSEVSQVCIWQRSARSQGEGSFMGYASYAA